MNMLYGGPLGTYLSGLSSTSSSPSSSSTNATSYLNSSSSVYNSPSNSTNYYSGISGLRRSSSRYRNSTSGNNLSTTSTSLNTTNSSNISNNNSNSNTVSGTNPYSSYYTPPVRRKYGTPETDTPKPSRYLTRTQGLSSNSGSGIVSVGVGSSCSVTGTSTSSYSGLPQYPLGGIGTSSSWNSDLSSAASKTPNYKQLYEEEKLLTNGLREEVKAAQKELKELEDALENSVGRRRPSEVEQRKMERRISECEQELKLIEKLRAESEKLHAEHRALIRVVSRLNREQ
ncbi:hypothetical protein MS3_00002719 [Schistosoma haematobium]|uniref:cGMP-dependent protein kinase interacting domain-containing protein n=1 Tax=Schistosoma haematobium TaxID=6185 RepID=A0A922LMP7_SCHHA|nr:hypothetical protein MS3_00002719 [Schistosoma haematobium]KAH9589780.1 hypothetical protein MS3_00002719 [Schistosoma haematobium]